MIIYLSGKVTGIEEEAKILFAQAEKALKAHGHTVVNPMNLPHLHDKSWKSYMKECITAQFDCDAIYFISNWEQSKGAKAEHVLAHILEQRVFHEGFFNLKEIEHVSSGKYQATVLDVLEVIRDSFEKEYGYNPKVVLAINTFKALILVNENIHNYSVEKHPLWNCILEGHRDGQVWNMPFVPLLPELIDVIHYTIIQHAGTNIGYKSIQTLEWHAKFDNADERRDKWADVSENKAWKALMEKRQTLAFNV